MPSSFVKRLFDRKTAQSRAFFRSYARVVEAAAGDRLARSLLLVRVGLALFVVAWLFGLFGLQSLVPVWLAFLIALGLEVQLFVGAPRTGPLTRRDRLPQLVDRERLGYGEDAGELLLVHREGEEFWIPYSGETGDELEELIADATSEAEEEEQPPAELAPERGRPVRQLVAGLALIAGLAALVWVVDSRSGWDGLDAETRGEAADRFSAEAARIAGHPVTIRCDESGDYVGAVQHADGVASIGGRLAYLAPERCLDLYRLAFKDEVAFSQTARSIAVLAHEAWHLRGVRDEGTTECYALQSGVEIGQRLGLSERTARQMMRQQLAENALRGGASAEYLVTPECRDGGRLDLDPSSSNFP
jgi:hypothetical protein